MSWLGRTAPAGPAIDDTNAGRCMACRREDAARERVDLPGVGRCELCLNTAACKRYWPPDTPGLPGWREHAARWDYEHAPRGVR